MDTIMLIGSILIICIVWKTINRILLIPQLSNLDSRYILITGCDTGFGNAAAKRLDCMGCYVIAGCLTEAGETDLKKSCSSNLKTVHMDVSSHESVQKAYKKVCDMLPKGKGLWGILNNAGIIGNSGPTDWMTRDDFHQVLSVNLFGLVDVTLTFLPLIKKEKGRIVNTASIAGRVAAATSPYTVSKHGVEAFSDYARRDLKHFGVTTHIIEPEFFKTQITNTDSIKKTIQSTYERLPDATKAEYGIDYLKGVLVLIERSMENMPVRDITPVVDAYTHALLGKYPKARYLVGKRIWMWLTIQALPEWLGDRILAGFAKDRPLPAACKH